ncbi:MAG TPA: hypothetical protein VF368_06050 [Gemmatimonadaceae bacterium]
MTRSEDSTRQAVTLEGLERALGEEATLDGPSVVRPAQRRADFDPRAQVLGRVERAERGPGRDELHARFLPITAEEPPVPEDESRESTELRARQDGLSLAPARGIAPRDRGSEIGETVGRIGRRRLFEDMGRREAARRVVEV